MPESEEWTDLPESYPPVEDGEGGGTPQYPKSVLPVSGFSIQVLGFILILSGLVLYFIKR